MNNDENTQIAGSAPLGLTTSTGAPLPGAKSKESSSHIFQTQAPDMEATPSPVPRIEEKQVQASEASFIGESNSWRHCQSADVHCSTGYLRQNPQREARWTTCFVPMPDR